MGGLDALTVIGLVLVGLGLGGMIGLWYGERAGGDYNLYPVFTGPVGAIIGMIVFLVLALVVI